MWAETIHLKDGKVVSAKILTRSDKQVTVDWYGVPVTYWMDEIERIDDGTAATPSITEDASAAILSAAAPPSIPLPSDQVALINVIIQQSGLAEELQQMAPQFADRLHRSDSRLTPQQAATLDSIIREAFSPERLRASAIATFARAYDRDKLSRVSEWLKTPLAQQMVALEREASGPGAADLAETPAPETRVALLHRLSAATNSTDAALSISSSVVQAMGRALKQAGRTVPADAERTIEAAKEADSEYRHQLETEIMARWRVIYRGVSDEDLGAYVRFWESDLGQWFNHLSVGAIGAAIGEAAERAVEEMLKSEGASPSPDTSPLVRPAPGGDATPTTQ